MVVTFTGTVLKDRESNATGIEVPQEVVAALGKGKNPKVKITLNDYSYQGMIQTSSGHYMISLSAAKREAAGLQAGDKVDVALELDTGPRLVEVPEDLRDALSQAEAYETFEALSFSKRKEFVRQVEEAKAQETRNRRIATVVAQVGGSK